MSGYLTGVLAGIRTAPGRDALVHRDRRLSHGEVLDLTLRTAHALGALGLGPGDTVACLTGSSPEAVVTRLAVQLLGSCHVQLQPFVAPAVQAAVLRTIRPRALVFSPELRGPAGDTLALADPALVLCLGPADAPARDLLTLAAASPAAPLDPAAVPEDAAAQIMHTSGTTGTPKAAVHSFANAAEWMRMERVLHGPGPRRFLLHGSLDSVAGENVLWTLAAGGTAVLLDDSAPGHLLETAVREEITYFLCYPSVLAALAAECSDHPPRLPALRQIEYGSAPASARTVHDALAVFGPRLLHVYGQRECGFLTALGTAEHTPELLRSAGQPFPGVTLEVRDTEGNPLPTGRIGEVWARTPAVMTGYLGQPEATAEVLRDGWLRTGDLGRLDQQGRLFLADRADDMIIVDGYNVYTSEVEEALLDHPAVTRVAALGLPDDRTGERVHAAVVAAGSVDPCELRSLVRRALGPFHEPQSIALLPELPVTAKGQPDRRALRAAALADLP
ncbi:class I adenylate-forming enzyme family protein [Streptomyces puniciscabiei]|uniref:class I adenylate-forming enzyme family protein n=1 Tax=Streptomyces puniciscabiei TaxID=164348 RepID=UPI00378B2495